MTFALKKIRRSSCKSKKDNIKWYCLNKWDNKKRMKLEKTNERKIEKMKNDKTIDIVERERERESYI